MKVAIIEIMPDGHYTLVDSVSKIYASDNKNQVTVITTPKGRDVLIPLSRNKSNISFEIISEIKAGTINEILDKLNPDKLYIITLSNYFQLFSKLNYGESSCVFIHNIDLWFNNNLIRSIAGFFKSIKGIRQIPYSFKLNFMYVIQRKKLVKLFTRNKTRLAVLNDSLKTGLSEFYDKEKIDVIPFSVYEPGLNKQNKMDGLIRLCLPGMVSSFRRDYFSFFKILEDDFEYFKNKVEIDLLGGVSQYEDGLQVIDYAKKLKERGLAIHLYEQKLVPILEFDEELAKAHLIIGNFNVKLSQSSSYGKTKDSGAIFTCIHAAKPGLMPSSYPIMESMKSSVIPFNDYSHLGKILKDLLNDRSGIEALTANALQNSLKFEPSAIYRQIEKK
jgi:hypothetical protein